MQANQTLPDIILKKDQIRNNVDKLIQAMVDFEGDNPTLFQQDHKLVRVGRPAGQPPKLTVMGRQELKVFASQVANFYQERKLSHYKLLPFPTSPTNEMIDLILARVSQPPYLPFPLLKRLVEMPVFRPDGSLINQSGYDASTFIYYAPTPELAVCQFPAIPTNQERDNALALIWNAIGEFSFATPADRANALALLLTPFLRSAITGHIPLALIDATIQGTGKTLLAKLVSILISGCSPAFLSLSHVGDDMQRILTAQLQNNPNLIILDNISSTLQSPHLDSLLTADVWQERGQGSIKSSSLPNSATWIATGNQLKLGGDLARRCYLIRLTSTTSQPYLRSGFTHSDLEGWVTTHRVALIRALLILARSWYTANSPPDPSLPALASFTPWVQTVGGILAHAGVPDFLTNLSEVHGSMDNERQQWKHFLSAWHALLGEDWFPVKFLVEAFKPGAKYRSPVTLEDFCLAELLPDTLQIVMSAPKEQQPIGLGKALAKQKGIPYGPEALYLQRKRIGYSGAVSWRVIKTASNDAGGVSAD